MRLAFSLPLLVLVATARADEPAPKVGDLVTTQAGAIPIIISAPHGGRKSIPDCPTREGRGVEQFVTVNATNTSELAEKLSAKIEKVFGAKPYLVIARCERKYVDMNRPPEGAYESDKAKPYYDEYHGFLKRACAEVQRDWGRGILLDLHGQAVISNAIYRGTRDLTTVTVLKDQFGKGAVTGEKSFLGQLGKRNYKLMPPNDSDDREMKFNGGYIVSTYGSHEPKGVDAIQLEFGGEFRARTKLEKTAEDMTDALMVFAKEYLPKEKKK